MLVTKDKDVMNGSEQISLNIGDLGKKKFL